MRTLITAGCAQAALRKRAVRAVLDGMSQAEAARVFGMHPNAVNRWINRYRQGSRDGLSERRRGRRAGEQPALAAPQQQEVVALSGDSLFPGMKSGVRPLTRDGQTKRATSRSAPGPARMACLRNLVIGVLCQAGPVNLAAALRHHARNPHRALVTLGISLG
jgi:transposase-like protein